MAPAPMSHHIPTTEFLAKTWIFVVGAIVLGGLAAFSLILGPLFLFEVAKNARGQPAPDAGLALTIMSVPLALMFALAVFNIAARRRPLLRVCREGLAINLIGTSSLDGVPLVPTLVRVAWLIVTLQGFRQQILFAPWASFRGASISGLPMVRKLTIAGDMYRSSRIEPAEPFANQVVLDESAFVVPLEQIAGTINEYRQQAELRDSLGSWIR